MNRLARVEQLPPERFLLLPRWRGWLPNVGRVDNECCNGLHCWSRYRVRTIDHPFSFLPFLLDDFLPFLVLPPPFLMGSMNVRLLPVLNDLKGSGSTGRRRLRKVGERVSVWRELQQFRWGRRRFGPPDFGKWLKRFKRRRGKRRSRSTRYRFSKRSGSHNDRINRLDG